MQLFECPFCGLRDEREFHFAGEVGKTRPATGGDVSAEQWGAYLHDQRNAKGAVREVWMHLPCAEIFEMRRDSVTMAVLGVAAFRRGA